MKKLLLVLAGAVLLTACGDKQYTVDEFVKNKELRTEIIKKCKNGELDREKDLNCKNASRAELRAVWKNHEIKSFL